MKRSLFTNLYLDEGGRGGRGNEREKKHQREGGRRQWAGEEAKGANTIRHVGILRTPTRPKPDHLGKMDKFLETYKLPTFTQEYTKSQ